MSGSQKYIMKIVLSVVGLAGAGFFTFSRISGDSNQRVETQTVEMPSEQKPLDAPQEKTSEFSEKSSEKTSLRPKALKWEDYLNYDPFANRNQPNEALYALASQPTVFYGEEIPLNAKEAKTGAPTVLQQLVLSAVLIRSERRYAVLNGRSFAAGDTLTDDAGNPIKDPIYGGLEVTQVELDYVKVKTGGKLFVINLTPEENNFIRSGDEKSPKSEKKKDE